MKTFFTLFFMLVLTVISQAQVLHVPQDYATIQEAINAAQDGDVVLVAEGTYFENINFIGKSITVASLFITDQDTSHISKTIIDGSQHNHPDSGSVVYMVSGEDTTSVLMGFTITGGSGTFHTVTPPSGPSFDARSGAGIYAVPKKGASIVWNIIENNQISTDILALGGGISAGAPAQIAYIIIENNTIRNNSISGEESYVSGGAIFMGSNGRIIDNTISGNSCHSVNHGVAGGAIRFLNVEEDIGSKFCLIENNTINDNLAVSENGSSFGGALANAGLRMTLRNNLILSNIARGHVDYSAGGGVYLGALINGQHLIENNLFFGNAQDGGFYGGGLGVYGGSPLIRNNIFVANTAGYGGGFFQDNSASSQLVNNTFSENSASSQGGGVYSTASTLNVMNSIIWNNTAPAGLQIYRTGGSETVVYSDVQGGWEGEGNIASDPMFIDTLFHLSDSSRSIGAGALTNTFSGNDLTAPEFDFDGNPRPNPVGSRPDIGAMENSRPNPASTFIKEVPSDLYATIQSGIDNAINGDTVLVAEGTYFENINFKGKAITVASHFILDQDTSHISKTIINGSQPSDPNKASVVTFNSGEDTTSVLCGFTITGGKGLFTSGVGWQGGGIVGRHAGAHICNNIIENNHLNSTNMQSLGGGICIFPDDAIIENNIIRNNSAQTNDSYAWGGGIFFQASGRITGNTITNNQVSYTGSSTDFSGLGGGISCFENDEYIFVDIQNNIITENLVNSTTRAYGGGVDLIWTNTEFRGNTVSLNKANGLSGNTGCGMRMIVSESGNSIVNNVFSFNTSIGGEWTSGGGLVLSQINGIKIQENNFEYNESAEGGGLLSYDSDPVISNNFFKGNQARYGGGIASYVEAPAIVKNIFAKNHADSVGGGIALWTEEEGGTIKQHLSFQANSHAMGLSPSQQSKIDLQKSTSSGPALIINNTFTENSADSAGGAFSTENMDVEILNSILWDNTSEKGAELWVNNADVSVSYSDIQGGWVGDDNLDADPLFVADDSLYHLSVGSPCIDAGNPDPAYNDPEDPGNPGYALWPSLGTILNDMGAYAGVTDSLIVTGLVELSATHSLPMEFVLHQNYPNPFNPITNIEFQIPHVAFVTLKIYNVLGQEIASLIDKGLNAGEYNFKWDASNFASGVYFYKLSTKKGFTKTRKLLLVK